MADLAGGTDSGRDARNHSSRLMYAFDAGFLSGKPPSDTPCTVDVDDEGPSFRSSPDSMSNDSVGESRRWADLAASVDVFAESLMRMELAEMEMIKAREASRVEAERRRLESEAEMTQMLLKTQVQVASFLSQKNRKRKRKRDEEDDSLTGKREAVLLLGLLQCGLGF